MDWSDHLTRLRRWVRDPNGDIFTDAFLRRIFNDELQEFYGALGPVNNIKVVRTHPSFQHSYAQDWEWSHTDHAAGEVYQFGGYYDAGEYVYLYVWEPETLKGYSATTYEHGEVYAHPWEAWMTFAPFFPPPIPMPSDYESVMFMAHDRDRVDPSTKKEIIRTDDTTWKTRAGSAINYWRDEKNSNWIYLYPLPSMTWQDGEIDSGDPDTAEWASVADHVTFGSEYLYFGSELLTFDETDSAVDTDHNILLIYRVQPAEITATDDDTGLPEYLQKYVEYGTASRALRANTDGRIESLADYWEVRKKAGYEVIKKWKNLKMSDRDIQLKSYSSSGIGRRPKYPRLPATYADPWS